MTGLILPGQSTGPTIEDANRALQLLSVILAKQPGLSIAPLLPLLFSFKGKPLDFTSDYFVHEPVFKLTGRPRRQLLKASRQVGKTLGAAADAVLLSALIPHFKTLVAHPRQDQSNAFSTDYVRPLIKESPLFAYMSDLGNSDAVRQRGFVDGGALFFRYIANSADTSRGLPIDNLVVDEVQDHDMDNVGIVIANMLGSKYKFQRFSGTAKTKDGPIEMLWQDSSQGVWVTPCAACGNWSHAAGDELVRMLGDETIVCARSDCGRPVNPREGHYEHLFPDRFNSFAGYNMPGPILPRAWANPIEWFELKRLQRTLQPREFMNEYLGESFDNGAKLITSEEVKTAAVVPWKIPEPNADVRSYIMTTLGVDWGGKGKETAQSKEEFVSQTAFAGAGMCGDGSIDVFWLWAAPYTASYDEESSIACKAGEAFDCRWIAHDAGGGGDLRQSMLLAKGYPIDHIAPFTYTGNGDASNPIVLYNPPPRQGIRVSYSIDKSRSIGLLIILIKAGIVRLPNFADCADLLQDFQNIYEETRDRPTGGPQRLIRRLSKRHDDVVHAINFAVMSLFHATDHWPEIALAYGAKGPVAN